jgi:hypothetical protein
MRDAFRFRYYQEKFEVKEEIIFYKRVRNEKLKIFMCFLVLEKMSPKTYTVSS